MIEQFSDPHLDAALRILREQTAPLAAPRAVEDALLAAFAQRHPVKKLRWFDRFSRTQWGAGAGLAGAALTATLLLTVLTVPAPPPAPAPAPAPAPMLASIDDDGDFIALASAEHIAREPAPQLIETEVVRTSLAGLGVSLSPENAGDLVRAQFLIDAEGRPLAMRLLPPISLPQPDRG